MSDVHDLISEGLKANIPIDDIVADLAASDNPEEKAWAERWKATAAAPEYQPGAGIKEDKTGAPSAGLLEKVDQMTPGQIAAGVIGTGLALKAPNMYQAYQQNKIDNRKLDIEARKADLYAQQVNKQGMAPAVAEPSFAPELAGAPEAPKLSPLEEARINTERARAEAIQAKIALEERKIALAEQKAKAAQEAKSATASAQKTTASGAVNPEDRQMLQSSEKAKMDKAITAEQKAAETTSRAAQAAEALAVPPPVAPAAPVAAAPTPAPVPVANQPVVPPKGPEITLTPSPEVAAEMQVTPKEAVPEAAPRPAGSVPPKAKDKLTFKKIEELPKEMQFKAGVGGGDSWLHDTVGPDIRKFIIDEFNGGKPIGGGKEGMEKAYGMVNKYEQWLKENIPEQTLTRAERKFAGIPPAKQYGPLGKTVKVAGAAGLLMTAAQAANAQEMARNVGEAMLPIGMTPSEVQSGKLPALELKERNEQFILNQPGNRAELEAKIKGKSSSEANKIREEYLASAPISDFERASRVFRQQASAKQGIAPRSMR